uniref:Pheromone n=1 Tax=Coprinopsis cinerea TaxID=5346 RepID=O74277_COPCI|nr:pheromone [Coprinopsis cinerea]
MSDSFISFDSVVGPAHSEASETIAIVDSQSSQLSAIDPRLSSTSLDELNDLPVEFERRTHGGNGLTFWCVIA